MVHGCGEVFVGLDTPATKTNAPGVCATGALRARRKGRRNTIQPLSTSTNGKRRHRRLASLPKGSASFFEAERFAVDESKRPRPANSDEPEPGQAGSQRHRNGQGPSPGPIPGHSDPESPQGQNIHTSGSIRPCVDVSIDTATWAKGPDPSNGPFGGPNRSQRAQGVDS